MYVKSLDSTIIVNNSSVLILPSNNLRRAVSVCNPSLSVIWLCKGTLAAVGRGILLNALGGTYIDELDGPGNIYTGIYSAIAVTAGSNVIAMQEDFFEN